MATHAASGSLPRPSFDAPVRVLLVVAPFYRDIADALVAGAFDGYVALGCVIRGETTHYETVCNDSSRGLTLLGLEGVPVGNGILTVENHAQAWVRADPQGADKGGGAADAALHLVALARRFSAGKRA